MFKDFAIEQVFTIKKVYGQPQKTYKSGNVPYVTGAKDNNGVVGFVSADEKSISGGNCISVDPITGLSCYQPVDFVGRGFSGASINLLYNDNLDEKNALFMCSVIEKVASNVAAYTNLFNSTRLATAKIRVPVIENSNPNHEYTVDDIDWQYMHDRIQELERDRIQELDAYLQATGLNNYELTMDEEMALKGFFDGEISFTDFRVGDLFNIHPTATYKMTNDALFSTKGNTPVLSNSSVNNGIGGYCGLEPTEVGNIITFSDTTTGGDTMFYQENPFIGYSHVQGMYPIDFKLDRHKAEYFISVIRKATGTGFNYANKFRRDIVGNTVISLPTNPDGSINWEYIYIYIYEQWRRKQSRKLSNTKRT